MEQEMTLYDLIASKIQGLDLKVVEENQGKIDSIIEDFTAKLSSVMPTEPTLEELELAKEGMKEDRELELKLMTVKELRQLIRSQNLKVPRLKSEMVKLLLEQELKKEPTSPIIPGEEIEPEGLEGMPNEMIEQVCENMDTETLAKFVRTNKRLKAVCSRILNRRKMVKEEKEELENIEEYQWELSFLDSGYVMFNHIDDPNRGIVHFGGTDYPIGNEMRTTLVRLDDEFYVSARARFVFYIGDFDEFNDFFPHVPIVFGMKSRATKYAKENHIDIRRKYAVSHANIGGAVTRQKLTEYMKEKESE